VVNLSVKIVPVKNVGRKSVHLVPKSLASILVESAREDVVEVLYTAVLLDSIIKAVRNDLELVNNIRVGRPDVDMEVSGSVSYTDTSDVNLVFFLSSRLKVVLNSLVSKVRNVNSSIRLTSNVKLVGLVLRELSVESL
jgi:hypothetical protein